jgi:copper chaperone CopZ
MRIEEYEQTIETINAILNNKGIAEVKIENGKKLVVVEVGRTVRSAEDIKNAR